MGVIAPWVHKGQKYDISEVYIYIKSRAESQRYLFADLVQTLDEVKTE